MSVVLTVEVRAESMPALVVQVSEVLAFLPEDVSVDIDQKVNRATLRYADWPDTRAMSAALGEVFRGPE